MCCVAAPVCDHLGHTVAAMSIVDHSERMTGGLADMYLNELRNAAAAMTAKMYPVETH